MAPTSHTLSKTGTNVGKGTKRVGEPEVGEKQCRTVSFGHVKTTAFIIYTRCGCSTRLAPDQTSQHSSIEWGGTHKPPSPAEALLMVWGEEDLAFLGEWTLTSF